MSLIRIRWSYRSRTYRSLSAVIPGIVTTWPIIVDTMSRCGLTSLRMFTSWRLSENSSASCDSLGFTKIWSSSSSMRSSIAARNGNIVSTSASSKPVQGDQPPVGGQPAERVACLRDGGHVVAVHADQEPFGVEAVHLGHRLAQLAGAVGDDRDEVVVVLDLRPLLELLDVLDRERVD